MVTETPKPRRRIVMTAEIEADSWGDLFGHLRSLTTQMAVDGNRLPEWSVSGGYGSGHTITVSEDETITHESWAARLQTYLGEIG